MTINYLPKKELAAYGLSLGPHQDLGSGPLRRRVLINPLAGVRTAL